jgi:hypothetical protein
MLELLRCIFFDRHRGSFLNNPQVDLTELSHSLLERRCADLCVLMAPKEQPRRVTLPGAPGPQSAFNCSFDYY